MTIECNSCNQSVWCLKISGEWICEACYLDEGGDKEEWDELNEEARAARQAKKEAQARGEYNDYNPRQQYNQQKKPREPPKPQECRYKCGSMLIWDYNLPGKNKFKDVNTGMQHSYDICMDIKRSKGLK